MADGEKIPVEKKTVFVFGTAEIELPDLAGLNALIAGNISQE